MLDKIQQPKLKTEVTVKRQQEIQKVFENTLYPQKGHTLFEINLVDKTIVVATFDSLPALKWEDADDEFLSTLHKHAETNFEHLWEKVKPNLDKSQTKGKIIIESTPLGNNWFYDMWMNFSENDKTNNK